MGQKYLANPIWHWRERRIALKTIISIFTERRAPLLNPLKQHFTNARPINELMGRLLGDVTQKTGLEPCIGQGALLEALVGQPRRVDGIDVDDHSLGVVNAQRRNFKVELFKDDFIDLFVEDLYGSGHPIRKREYDFVIANPPYGLHFPIPYRKKIKATYPQLYARESYGLFLTFALSRLKPGGRYVFLVPDTFLASTNHRPLREFLSTQAAPSDIVRFPSKLFETINFGYGRLCIIAGHRAALKRSDTIRWCDLSTSEELSSPPHERVTNISGSSLLESVMPGWSPSNFSNIEDGSYQRLEDIAECKTGIYTGDNQRFIGYDARRVKKRLNGHAIDWDKSLHSSPLDEPKQSGGIEEEPFYVPLIRGGHRDAFEESAWAINWHTSAISYYKADKKARFQNSAFYFKPGLAVPMVTTRRISASLLHQAVFDQGVVGVFPRDARFIPALLLYLNSRFASQKMKEITNGSANNSANYLKRLPIPIFFDQQLVLAADIVKRERSRDSLSAQVCDQFVERLVAYQSR